MAEKSIILTIGGIFKGEAFKHAQRSIKDLNGQVKQGFGATSRIASAFGSLDASVGKASAAISGLIAVLSAGSLPVAALTLAITAANAIFKTWEDNIKRSEEALKKLNEASKSAFAANLNAMMESASQTIKDLGDDFERITKQANAFAAAIEGVRAAGAQGGILKLQTEKLQKMIDAHTDAERQTIEAEYNIKIAVQKRIEAEDAGAKSIETATNALAENEKRVANIDEQLVKVLETRSTIEHKLTAIGENKKALDEKIADLEARRSVLAQKEYELAMHGLNTLSVANQLQDVTNELNGAKKVKEEDSLGYTEEENKLMSELVKIKSVQTNLEQKRNNALEHANVLDLQLQKAQQDAANATESATQGVLAAQLAQKKLTESIHAREVAEQAAKDAAEGEASAALDAEREKEEARRRLEAEKALNAAKEEEKKRIKEFTDIQKAINDSSRDLAAAQREYADAINKWIDGGGLAFDAIQQNLKKGNQSWTKAGVLDAATQQALAGKVGAFAVDQALAGGAKTVRDLQRAEREGQRRGRDALSADSGQMTREAKRYERLAKQDRDKLSKADKDFMDKFEKLRNANNEEKKKIADREANIKELATNAKELRKTADEIAKKLDKLGLK